MIEILLVENLENNPFDLIDETTSKPRKRRTIGKPPVIRQQLVNIFSPLGFTKGNITFNAFGSPRDLNIRLFFDNKSLMNCLSYLELKHRLFNGYELPSYAKEVLNRICDKYLEISTKKLWLF